MDKERLEQFNADNILKAADCLFREFGYAQTTMDKIAKLANYSKTTVYAYFSSKEAVFFSIMLIHVKKLLEDFRAAVASGKGLEDTFHDLFYILVAMEEEIPVYFEGMIGNINMRLDDEDTPPVFREIYDTSNLVNEELFKLFDKGISENKIEPNINKEKTAFYLWSSSTGLIRMCRQKNDYFLMKNITREELLDFGFRSILKGIEKV